MERYENLFVIGSRASSQEICISNTKDSVRWIAKKFISAMIILIRTKSPSLELRGARGLARFCFRGPRGSDLSGFISDIKIMAAQLGAIGESHSRMG